MAERCPKDHGMTLKESVDLLTPIADSGALYAIGKNGKEALRAVLSALAGKDQRCSNCERLREERDQLAATLLAVYDADPAPYSLGVRKWLELCAKEPLEIARRVKG